jgi:hypothetical protein
MQLLHMTRRQHSVRWLRADGFSDLESYWGVSLLNNEAQVQHASSIIMFWRRCEVEQENIEGCCCLRGQ